MNDLDCFPASGPLFAHSDHSPSFHHSLQCCSPMTLDQGTFVPLFSGCRVMMGERDFLYQMAYPRTMTTVPMYIHTARRIPRLGCQKDMVCHLAAPVACRSPLRVLGLSMDAGPIRPPVPCTVAARRVRDSHGLPPLSGKVVGTHLFVCNPVSRSHCLTECCLQTVHSRTRFGQKVLDHCIHISALNIFNLWIK